MALEICEFQEYIGFVKCMNAMKGMKLCYKDRDSEKAWTSNIRVSWNYLYEVGCNIQVHGPIQTSTMSMYKGKYKDPFITDSPTG